MRATRHLHTNTTGRMKCLAIDDEPLALMQLASYIEKTPGLELAGKCSSAIEALGIIREGGADLIFCDIDMPDMSGIELVRQIGDQCLVVFTTAYPEYAVDGYKVEAVDYLLKPFSLSDLVAAAAKARKRLSERGALSAGMGRQGAWREGKEEGRLSADDYVYVKNDSKMSRVRVGDITLVEGMSEYVHIYVRGEKRPLTTLISMKKLESSLPSETFMRVHRSWIVNLERIESVSRMRITIAGQLVPVSDNYKDHFTEYMESHAIK